MLEKNFILRRLSWVRHQVYSSVLKPVSELSFFLIFSSSGYILTLQISVFDILFKGLISSIQPAFLSWVRQFINAKLQNNNTINKTFIYLGSLTELSTRTNSRYVMDSKLVVKLKGVLIFKLVLPLFWSASRFFKTSLYMQCMVYWS